MADTNLAATLHPLERKVLPVLATESEFPAIVKATGLQDVEVMRALQWLQNKKIIRINQELQELVELDENGKRYQKEGLPERKFLDSISEKTSVSEIKKKGKLDDQEVNICVGLMKQKAAIDISKDKELLITITKNGEKLRDSGFLEENFLKKEFPLTMSSLKAEEKAAVDSLKRRKQIIKLNVVKNISAQVTEIGKKVIAAGVSEGDILDKLTAKALQTGEWKKKELRQYDVAINVPSIHGGKKHFVDQSIEYIKRIWLDLGFKEMHGPLVQTSFWCFDALFSAQDHPVRDMQDTFFIKNPAKGKLPTKFTKEVQAAHENGWTTGSKGWQYKWDPEKAKENILRTHTTGLSVKAIAQLKKEDLPAKFFSVGKVFRNETLSWKHLFEFTQVEGIVVDPNANFKHLKGYLKEFFAKMGFPDVRIRPAHFPYTEPSAEVDVWHPRKKTWVELGGSGIFRPEVVKPLLGVDVPVLAWGLGLERGIMEYYELKDVRDIYRNDIKQLREMKLWMK